MDARAAIYLLAAAALAVPGGASSSHPTLSPTALADRTLNVGHHPIQAQGGEIFPFP
jgi:hypothetical protein